MLAILAMSLLIVPKPANAKDEQTDDLVHYDDCGYVSCDNHPFPRWAMAVWLVRIVDGPGRPGVSATRFVDVRVDEHWAPYVERLFELGITRGCGVNPARYCPEERVTRAQMASFLVRAFNLEEADSGPFTDIGASGHADDINALVASGVAEGCRTNLPELFCPHTSPTVGQMRAIMQRAVELNNPGN
ncbi:MAG: S-layer homology domain-containing protein [Actinomycetia bacterium]|nr:S-layer homology domain-containing protein [Actinomycetes bacterium]